MMKIKHSKRNSEAVVGSIKADDRYLEFDESGLDLVAVVMLEDIMEGFQSSRDERNYVRHSPHAITLILVALTAFRTATLDRIEQRLKEDAKDGK